MDCTPTCRGLVPRRVDGKAELRNVSSRPANLFLGVRLPGAWKAGFHAFRSIYQDSVQRWMETFGTAAMASIEASKLI